jgi:hypothetical protein
MSWTQMLRTNTYYQRLNQVVKWSLLPDWIMAPIIIQFFLWLALVAYGQTALDLVERSSSLCRSSASTGDLTMVQRDFRTRDLCSDSFGRVYDGLRYAVTFDVVEPWFDGHIAASPTGIGRGEYPLLWGYLATPFLRALDARILQPVMKITSTTRGLGLAARSVYIAPLSVQRSGDGSSLYEGEFLPGADGELFLFANDAMIPFGRTAPTDFFYQGAGARENHGTACVTVRRLDYPYAPPNVAAAGSICAGASVRGLR